jgi:hypothetical protein
MSAAGWFVWYELLTRQQDTLKAFYMKVFRWDTEPFGGPDKPYFVWKNGVAVGGCMAVLPAWDTPELRTRWWGYVAVDDVDAMAERAKSLGATLTTPPTDIPGVGRFAIFLDPQGAMLGLLQSRDANAGAPPMKPGFVAWNELATNDAEGAWTFYSQLFGWAQAMYYDMGPAGTYRIFRPADALEELTMGGIFHSAARSGKPASWMYYVNVDSMEGALERVRAAGGTVRSGPNPVPGGESAVCRDPEGNGFGIFALV